MNIDATAPADTGRIHSWKTIPWNKVKESVSRLQIRIAKAWREGKYRMVKNLQQLLSRSYYAKLLAVQRVTSNRGSKTPGVDKVLWRSPEVKLKAAQQLGKGTYNPSPLRRVYILKKNGKKRGLGIPTMSDRALQALHTMTLVPIAETQADHNSYGFREARSAADAIGQCFTALSRKSCAEYILEGDIKACFDKISHEWLLNHIPMDKAILRKMLKSGFMEEGALYPTDEGTPQGGIISPVLANMTLDGIESLLKCKLGKRREKHKVNFIRYADDFVITADSKELLENEIKPMLTEFLKERGLLLSEEKTITTSIHEGFDFLGQSIRKYRGKLLIKPSKKAVESLLNKVRDTCKDNKQITTLGLIYTLNPIIRGWANYHRHVVSSETFNKVDHEIFRITWQWAKRRHPNKTKSWVYCNYYKTTGTTQLAARGEDGQIVQLLKASKVKIRRHTKIKQEANPYDADWECYFERRQQEKMRKNYQGRQQLVSLRKAQKGQCIMCRQEMPMNESELHFKQAWTHKGSDNITNLALIHPQCHQQLHAKYDQHAGSHERPY
jgi:RNA-directed DNA polymerase